MVVALKWYKKFHFVISLKHFFFIISEIKALTSEVELEKNTFNKFRGLQKKWNSTGHVNIRDKNELQQMYNHYTEVFYDYLKLNRDLRDLDFKHNL